MTPCAIADLRIGKAYQVDDGFNRAEYQAILTDVSPTEYQFYVWEESRNISITSNNIVMLEFYLLDQVMNSEKLTGQINAIQEKFDVIRSAAQPFAGAFEGNAVFEIEIKSDKRDEAIRFLLEHHFPYSVLNNIPYILNRKENNDVAYELLIYTFLYMAQSGDYPFVSLPFFQNQKDLYAVDNKRLMRRCARELKKDIPPDLDVSNDFRMSGVIVSLNDNGRGTISLLSNAGIRFNLYQVAENRLFYYLRSASKGSAAEVEFSFALAPDGNVVASRILPTAFTAQLIDALVSTGKINYPISFDPQGLPETFFDIPVCGVAQLPSIIRNVYEWAGRSVTALSPVGTKRGVLHFRTIKKKKDLFEGLILSEGNAYRFNSRQILDSRILEALSSEPTEPMEVLFEPCMNFKKVQDMVCPMADAVRLADAALEVPSWFRTSQTWDENNYSDEAIQTYASQKGANPEYASMQPWLPAFDEYVGKHAFGTLKINPGAQSSIITQNGYSYVFLFDQIRDAFLYSVLNSRLIHMLDWNSLQISVLFIPYVYSGDIPKETINAGSILLTYMGRLTLKRQIHALFHPQEDQLPNRLSNLLIPVRKQYIPWEIRKELTAFNGNLPGDEAFTFRFDVTKRTTGTLSSLASETRMGMILSKGKEKISFSINQISDERLLKAITGGIAKDLDLSFSVRISKKDFSAADPDAVRRQNESRVFLVADRSWLQAEDIRLTEEGRDMAMLRNPALASEVPSDAVRSGYRTLQEELLSQIQDPSASQAETDAPADGTIDYYLKQMLFDDTPNDYDELIAAEGETLHSFSINTSLSLKEYESGKAFYDDQATQAKKALGDIHWREAAARYLIRYDVLTGKYREMFLLLDAVNRNGLFTPEVFVRMAASAYVSARQDHDILAREKLKRIASAIISAANLISLKIPELSALQRMTVSADVVSGQNNEEGKATGEPQQQPGTIRYYGDFDGLTRHGTYGYIKMKRAASGMCNGSPFSFSEGELVFVYRSRLADQTLAISHLEPSRLVSFLLRPPDKPGFKPQAYDVRSSDEREAEADSFCLEQTISRYPYLSACVRPSPTASARHLYYTNLKNRADLSGAIRKDAEAHFALRTRSSSRCAAYLCSLAAEVSADGTDRNAGARAQWLKIAGIDPNQMKGELRTINLQAIPFFTGVSSAGDNDDRQYIVMLLRSEPSRELLNAIGALDTVSNEQNQSWIRQINETLKQFPSGKEAFISGTLKDRFNRASLEARNGIRESFSRYGGLGLDRALQQDMPQQYTTEWWNDTVSAIIDRMCNIGDKGSPMYLLTDEEREQAIQFQSILAMWRELYGKSDKVSFLMNGLNTLRVETNALWSNLLSRPTETGCIYFLPRMNEMKTAAEKLYNFLCRRPHLQVNGVALNEEGKKTTINIDDENHNFADEVNGCRKIMLKIENSGINQTCRNLKIDVGMNGADASYELSGITCDEQDYRPVHLSSGQSMEIICRFIPRDGFGNQLRRDFSFTLQLDYDYDESIQTTRHYHQSVKIKAAVAEWDNAKDRLKNPFSHNRDGMDDKEIAYGRDVLLDTLYSQVWDDDAGMYMGGCFLIFGQRRVGKTTVIQKLSLRLRQEAPGNQQPIVICNKLSMGSYTDRSSLNEVSMYRGFAREICRCAKGVTDKETEEKLNDLKEQADHLIPNDALSPYECFKDRFLDRFNDLFDADMLPHIVLFVDEFNTLYEGMLNGNIQISSVNRLLRITEEIHQITMIFASSDIYLSMNALDTGLSNTFEHVHKFPVFGIDYEDAMKLILRPVQNKSGLDSSSRFAQACADTIFNWTGGNPNYMTQICRAAIVYLNKHSLYSMRPDHWPDFSFWFFNLDEVATASFYESQISDARRADSQIYTNLLQVYNARLLGEIGKRSITVSQDMIMSRNEMRFVSIRELDEVLPEEPIWTEEDLTRILMKATDSDRQKLSALVDDAKQMSQKGNLFSRTMALRWLCDRHVLENDLNGGYRLTLPLYAVHRSVIPGFFARIYEKTMDEV